MSDVKKLGVPFLIIFVSALATKLLTTYFISEMSSTLVKLIMVVALCIFGASLNRSRNKRSSSVWKKVIAVLIIVFLLFMQLNLFTFAGVSTLFNFFGVESFYINMLYIFCGYMMVD